MSGLPVTPLTQAQRLSLQDAVNKHTVDGNYSAAYSALKSMLPADRYNTQAWIDVAMATNGNDHGFIDTSLRNITKDMITGNGKDYSDSKYQEASNNLAQKLLQEIITKGEIPDIQKIATMDSKSFSEGFGLPDGSWPGSLIDGFVLGGNWVVNKDGTCKYTLSGGAETVGEEIGSAAKKLTDALLKKIFGEGYLNSPLYGGLPATLTKNDLELLKDLLKATGANLAPYIGLPLQELLLLGLIKLLSTAESTISPLIVDLNGDGISTISLDNGVYFDHDGNHFAERTGWVNAQDGLLVRDLNNDGLIDSGRELFGSETLLANGRKAPNGFDALAELDSNSDHIFDSKDNLFSTVQVWRDANSNGVVDTGELLSLAQADIASIGLNHSSESGAFKQTAEK